MDCLPLFNPLGAWGCVDIVVHCCALCNVKNIKHLIYCSIFTYLPSEFHALVNVILQGNPGNSDTEYLSTKKRSHTHTKDSNMIEINISLRWEFSQ